MLCPVIANPTDAPAGRHAKSSHGHGVESGLGEDDRGEIPKLVLETAPSSAETFVSLMCVLGNYGTAWPAFLGFGGKMC